MVQNRQLINEPTDSTLQTQTKDAYKFIHTHNSTKEKINMNIDGVCNVSSETKQSHPAAL
jgi:hypothetical protein